MSPLLTGVTGPERTLIVNALREKANGDADAAGDCGDSHISRTLRDQADMGERLADALELPE